MYNKPHVYVEMDIYSENMREGGGLLSLCICYGIITFSGLVLLVLYWYIII